MSVAAPTRAGARVATMRAAFLAAPRSLRVEQTPIPEPGAGDVLVRIEGCGLCGSNVPVWDGSVAAAYPLLPGAPGHEAWGAEVETGRRVALLSYRAFAEYDVAAADAVVPLPRELDGVPFPGEPLACAVNAFRRSGVRAGQTVAVVGIGFLGALFVQLAVVEGAQVVAFSRRPYSLEVARSFGAEIPPEPKDESCDVVIEAAGTQSTLDLATRLVRTGGRLVIAGYHQDGPRQVDLRLWNWRGLDVVNAHERDPRVYVEGLRAAVAMVVAGTLDPAPLYTHAFPLERLDQAFAAAEARPQGFVKALVTP